MASSNINSSGPSEVPVDASPRSSSEVELSRQSNEFLVARVQALERQLTIRNADCTTLLQERQALLPLKAKCESQKEMILALREQLSVMQAERDSALDAVEGRARATRNAEHDALKEALAMNGATAAGPTTTTLPTGAGQGARVIKTSHAGTQVIYDSSDISSLGFQAGGAAPYDFLGGMGAYRGSGGTTMGGQPTTSSANTGAPVFRAVVGDDSDDAEVQKAMYRARDEAQLELKQADREAQEEARLRARLEALRQGNKKP